MSQVVDKWVQDALAFKGTLADATPKGSSLETFAVVARMQSIADTTLSDLRATRIEAIGRVAAAIVANRGVMGVNTDPNAADGIEIRSRIGLSAAEIVDAALEGA